MFKMRILVTGGTGLIGSALKDIVDSCAWIFVGSEDADLTDPYETDYLFRQHKPEVVLHLAGVVHGAKSTCDQQFQSLMDNTLINTNIFRCCQQYGIQRLIVCSSVLMQKWSESGPPVELNKHHGYLHAKQHLEALCVGYRRAGGSVTIVYLSNIYGYQDLEESDRLIPSIYRQMIQTQIQSGVKGTGIKLDIPCKLAKTFTYNYDIARAFQCLVEHYANLPHSLTVCAPWSINMESVLKTLSDEYGINVFSNNQQEIDNGVIMKCDMLDQYGFDMNSWMTFEQGVHDMNIRTKTNGSRLRPKPDPKITLGDFRATRDTYRNIFQSLKTGQLSYGQHSKEFEQKFAEMHDVRHAILSNSGTSALQIGIAALKELYGWSDGQEILVPSTTFVASVNVIISNRLKPVLVDVEDKYFGMNPDLICAKLTKKTVGIMVVHLFGQPCDMDPIMKIAKEYDLKVIEDSCETMLARYNGTSVGTFGDIAAFSTYVAHLITTGVGGITTTNNPDLAKLVRSLANHGRNNIYITIDDDDNVTDNGKFTEIVSKRFQFERVGYSYRITELEAGLGLVELNSLSENVARRRDNARYLTELLTPLSKYLRLPLERPGSDHSYMIYPLIVTGLNKRDLVMHLEHNGIETRDLMPITNQPVYNGKLTDDELCFTEAMRHEYPVSERLNENGLYIGCHQHLTRMDMEYIASVFKDYVEK